jgi:hypothetical protein
MKFLCRFAAGCLALSLVWGHSLAGPNEGLTENPVPTAAFSGYGSYLLKPLTMLAPYAGQGPNEKAAAKIREHIDAEIAPILSAWTVAGTASGKTGTLAIEPVVEQIKFIGGATRFWAGAFAGSSYVVMRLRISDQQTGAVLGQPEFFQRAAAISGAWSVGGQDNDMLRRIVDIATAYLNGNYQHAVGGPTGRVSK